MDRARGSDNGLPDAGNRPVGVGATLRNQDVTLAELGRKHDATIDGTTGGTTRNANTP